MSRLPTARGREKERESQGGLETSEKEEREDARALKAPRLRSSEPYEHPGHLLFERERESVTARRTTATARLERRGKSETYVSATWARMLLPLAVLVTVTYWPQCEPPATWGEFMATM